MIIELKSISHQISTHTYTIHIQASAITITTNERRCSEKITMHKLHSLQTTVNNFQIESQSNKKRRKNWGCDDILLKQKMFFFLSRYKK